MAPRKQNRISHASMLAIALANILTRQVIAQSTPSPATAPSSQPATLPSRITYSNSVVSLPLLGPVRNMVVSGLIDENARKEKLDIMFSVAVSPEVQKNLDERIARGEVIPAAEVTSKFGASQEDVDTLVGRLKEQHFEIIDVSADRTSVYTRATVGEIEDYLHVTMVRIVKDGVTYTAASNAPSLPNDVGNRVTAIIGLQPFRQLHKHGITARVKDSAKFGGDDFGTTQPSKALDPHPSPAASHSPPFYSSDIRHAYGAEGLLAKGRGQVIAVLIDTIPDASDLKLFAVANQLPAISMESVNVTGAELPPASGEETLDVEWSAAIAPEAKIRVYATGTLEFVALDRALDRILADCATTPTMRQVSISLGLGETFMGGPDGEVAIEHQKFGRLALAGVNVFVSTGDAGSVPDQSGHGRGEVKQAEYESSDSNVVAVGGTSLKLNTATGSVQDESGWTDGGGGESIFFDRPAWQKGLGINSGTRRLVPDVSAAADPNTGALIILQGSQLQYGGTSWSAPMWAGFCALMNADRAEHQKPMLPFLCPLIYPLSGTGAFRDVTAGSNGDYTATAGHDMVTGLGVPNVGALSARLESAVPVPNSH